MKNLFFFLPLLFILSACDANRNDPLPDTDITVSFKASFGADPLLMYAREYGYEAAMKLRIQLFQFYISDLSLLKESERGIDTIPLREIALVNFQEVQDDNKAREGIRFTIKNVAMGRYKGVHMGLGVSPRLNATNPGAYTPPHPLDGNYWSWAKGYIFTKIEGNADINGDGQFTEKLTFHIGENPFYRTKTFLQDFVIDEKNKQLDFDVDLRRVLVASPSNFLDFRAVTVDHTTNLDIAKFIADNLQAAVEMQKN